MFLNRTVLPDTFFAADGFPIIRLNRKPFRRFRWFLREQILKKPHKLYSKALFNAAELVKNKFGVFYNGLPHHNIDSYLKSDCLRVSEQIFKDEIDQMKMNHVRSSNDIQRVIYSYVALAEKRGHLQHVSSKDSLHVHIQKERHYERLEKINPTFFCMNDTEYADDNDRMKLKEWLNNRFLKNPNSRNDNKISKHILFQSASKILFLSLIFNFKSLFYCWVFFNNAFKNCTVYINIREYIGTS